MDHLKWVKFFFYITDVNTESGPHTFVAGSHKPLGIPFKLRNKGYVRLSDGEVASAFDSAKFKEFTGKRGTLIIEDTRGLHKGKHCISGDRLLFQLEYTASPYGQEIPRIEVNKARLTGESQRIRKEFDYPYQYIQIT
jgi:ectoine hydroxylase-related dioxygenase (phytanoyl-CoA dioxygenase family)